VINLDKNKVKLTLSINQDVINEAKQKTRKLGVSISKIVENFLKFYTHPTVYCFSCGEEFEVEKTETCPKCGWFICPHCGACGCNLDNDARKVAYQMRRVYEDLLIGKPRWRGD